MQPLYVGLDIDHKKIETSFVDQAGNLVSGPFSVANDVRSANSLAEVSGVSCLTAAALIWQSALSLHLCTASMYSASWPTTSSFGNMLHL